MKPRLGAATQIGDDGQQTGYAQDAGNHQYAEDLRVLEAEDEHSADDEYDDDAEHIGPGLVDGRVSTLIGNS